MSDVNDDQPKSYCTNCGAEVREGNVFCHVCGASLESTPPHPDASQTTSGPGTGVLTTGISAAFGRLVDWFWSLPNLIKLAIAAVVVLLVVIFLSPVMAFAFGLVAFACIAYAIFQLYQRRPSALPFGIAAASVVLFFVFIGVSSFIYGEDSDNEAQGSSGTEDNSETQERGGVDSGLSQVPDEEAYEYSSLIAEDAGEVVDIYLVEESQGHLSGAPADSYLFNPGYVIVQTAEDYYIHIDMLGQPEASGDVGPGGVLYLGPSDNPYATVGGNLNNFTYACSFELGDPRGSTDAIQDECGFSLPSY